MPWVTSFSSRISLFEAVSKCICELLVRLVTDSLFLPIGAWRTWGSCTESQHLLGKENMLCLRLSYVAYAVIISMQTYYFTRESFGITATAP